MWPPLPSPRTSLGTCTIGRGSREQDRKTALSGKEKEGSPKAAILSPGSLDTEGNDTEPESPYLTFIV